MAATLTQGDSMWLSDRPARWWGGAVGYEIYVPSFADGNGDGMGDLLGVVDRLDYLGWLGVDVIWLTPFYVSPLVDHGYDVADHGRIDPRFGDLEVFDALVDKAHRLGMRVIVDFVSNHTSDTHPWFEESRSSRSNLRRDWYLWRDGATADAPPNNWVSAFGGPAWSFDETSGQWWLHLNLPAQPDVNWRNQGVAEAYDRILRFWLERGVDGFRIDVAHELLKHPDLPDNPERAWTPDQLREPGTVEDWERFEHRYDLDQPGVLDIHRRWRRIADAYHALLLGEVYLLHTDKLARYLVAGDGLHAAFWVQPLALAWDPPALATSMHDALVATPPGSLAWVQGNHDDQARAATRFGGGETGRRRSLALATLLAGLPGMTFTYQGEELGLEDCDVAFENMQDPLAVRNRAPELSRDRVRTPMPWASGPGAGFTTAARTWLPVGPRLDRDTVAVQRADPDSMASRFRDLLRARRELAPQADRPIEWLRTGPVIAYRLGAVAVVMNGGTDPVTLPPQGGRTTVFSTDGAHRDHNGTRGAALTLQPNAAIIFRTQHASVPVV
jgi:alpha-glucosidase